MNTKNSKKLANDKIFTSAKQGRKKKEINHSNNNNSRKKIQKTVTLSSSQIINELINGDNNVQGHKKKQEAVASSSSQISDELLNNSDNLQDNDYFLVDDFQVTLLRKSSTLESNSSNNMLGHFDLNNILANCMNFSMQTPAADSSRFTLSILSAISTTISNPYDKLQIATKHFGDFHNKLINNVEKLVKEFKEKRTCSITSPLQKEEIIAFVDESTTINMLNQWLSTTNMDKLRAQNSISYLCTFIQSTFTVNYISRNFEGTKALDRLTKNIAVLLRNGKNFASNI
ncbi:5958_t:CDS:2 [Racocetra persica]|uniref:5958_t:CDS:1 n=1 Tax=Racocetra persica TaxID=160502 RepID=A0ACA9M147_9GLOM|nr:5958_t:CDS:2 [Racocetra persica]